MHHDLQLVLWWCTETATQQHNNTLKTRVRGLLMNNVDCQCGLMSHQAPHQQPQKAAALLLQTYAQNKRATDTANCIAFIFRHSH